MVSSKRSHIQKKLLLRRAKRWSAMASTAGYSGPLIMNNTYKTHSTPEVLIAERGECSGFGPTATVTVIILGVVVLLLLYLVALLLCLWKFYRKSQFRLQKQGNVVTKDIEANDDQLAEDCVGPVADMVAVVVETEDEDEQPGNVDYTPHTTDDCSPHNDNHDPTHVHHDVIHDVIENHADVVIEPVQNDDDEEQCPVNDEDEAPRHACELPEETGFESDVAVEGSDDDRIDVSTQSRDESDEERLDQSVIPTSRYETEPEIDPTPEHVDRDDASGEHEPDPPSPPHAVPETAAIVREAGDIEEDFSASMSDGADYSDQEPYPELHGTIPLQPTPYVHEPHDYDNDEQVHEPEHRTNPPLIYNDSESPPTYRRHYDNDVIVAPITPDRPYPESYDHGLPDSPPLLSDVPPPLPDINSKLYHPDLASYDEPSHHNGGEFYNDRDDAMNSVEADVHSNPDYVSTGYTNQVHDGEYPYALQYHNQPHEGHQ